MKKILIKTLLLCLLSGGVMAAQPKYSANLKTDALFLVLKAEFSLQQRHFATAYKDYLQVASQFPSASVARRLLEISALTKNKQWQEEALFESLKFDNKDVKLHQHYLSNLVAQGKASEAKKEVKVLLEVQKKSAETDYANYANLAVVLANSGNEQLGEKILKSEVKMSEKSGASLYGLALFYRVLKKNDDALQAIIQANLVQPNKDVIVMLYAEILYSTGAENEAIALLSTQVEKEKSIKVDAVLAAMLMGEKHYLQAVKVYQRLIREDAKETHRWQMEMGAAYILEGDFDNANKMFLAILESDTASKKSKNHANYSLGLVAEEKDNKEEAKKYYKKIRRGEYELPAKIRLSGLLAKEDKDAALAVLDSVSSVQLEDYNMLLMAQAAVYEKHEEWRAVYEIYTSALEMEASDDYYYARAIAAEKMGDIGLMEKDFLAIIENNKKDFEALNALGYSLTEHTTRYKEAKDYIERALELKPNAFHIMDSMGWVLYKLGNYEASLDYLQKAFKAKEDAEVAAHLAVVLKAQGDVEGSNKYLKQALEINKDNPTVVKVKKILAP